jgi:hypothetical protein
MISLVELFTNPDGIDGVKLPSKNTRVELDMGRNAYLLVPKTKEIDNYQNRHRCSDPEATPSHGIVRWEDVSVG